MVIVLLIKHFTDAMLYELVGSNFLHNCSFKGPIVNVELYNNEASWLAYAAYNIQRMRGLCKVVCDWGIVKVQPAYVQYQACSNAFNCNTTCF